MHNHSFQLFQGDVRELPCRLSPLLISWRGCSKEFLSWTPKYLELALSVLNIGSKRSNRDFFLSVKISTEYDQAQPPCFTQHLPSMYSAAKERKVQLKRLQMCQDWKVFIKSTYSTWMIERSLVQGRVSVTM